MTWLDELDEIQAETEAKIRAEPKVHVPKWTRPPTKEEVISLLQETIEYTNSEHLAIGLYHRRTGAYDDTLHPTPKKGGRFVDGILDILDELDGEGKLRVNVYSGEVCWKIDCRTCAYRDGLVCQWGKDLFADRVCVSAQHPSSFRVLSPDQVAFYRERWQEESRRSKA